MLGKADQLTAMYRNYTSAAVGAIMLLAVITWLTTGHKQFTGPESGGVAVGVVGGEPYVITGDAVSEKVVHHRGETAPTHSKDEEM